MQSEGGLSGGEVELDATYHGGRFDARRHRARRDKQAIMGVVQRRTEEQPSQVRAFLNPGETACQSLRAHCKSTFPSMQKSYSDEHGAYRYLKTSRDHAIVIHSKGEYVRGRAHTNTVENFWSLFKRGVIGSFHFVSVKHLQRYLNEFQLLQITAKRRICSG